MHGTDDKAAEFAYSLITILYGEVWTHITANIVWHCWDKWVKWLRTISHLPSGVKSKKDCLATKILGKCKNSKAEYWNPVCRQICSPSHFWVQLSQLVISVSRCNEHSNFWALPQRLDTRCLQTWLATCKTTPDTSIVLKSFRGPCLLTRHSV